MAFSSFITVLPLSIPATCPTHSDLLALITVTVSEDLNYYKFFDSLLFSSNHFQTVAHIFFSRFSLPTPLRFFPFHSSVPIIVHRRSQLVLALFYRDLLLINVLYIFSLVYSLVHCNICYKQQFSRLSVSTSFVFVRYLNISTVSYLCPLFQFILVCFLYLLAIYLGMNTFMSSQSEMLQLSYLLLFLQRNALQVPKLSHHMYKALSYSITDALNTLTANAHHFK